MSGELLGKQVTVIAAGQYHSLALKARRVPMTVLANQLVEQGLAQAEDSESPPESLTVREDPDPGR